VCGDHDPTFEPLQHVIEHRHVVGQRGHRQWRGDGPYPLGPQAGDHLIPARSIGPATVSQHNGYIGLRHSGTHALSIDQPSPRHTVNSDGITGTAADSLTGDAG
jgi:hypothetical protein